MILKGACSLCDTKFAVKPPKAPKRVKIVRCVWCHVGLVLLMEVAR